jgi:hypothetical protein
MKDKIYIYKIEQQQKKIKNKNLQVQMEWNFSLNNFGVRPSACSPGDGASDVVL